MFFDIILLNTQHRGRFGIAWLAATRGLRFITKKQIMELSLFKLCDELKLFIINYSSSPKKRFSLRLSALLINGVVKIFKEQAIHLEGEIVTLITTIHIPSGIRHVAYLSDTGVSNKQGIFETPPTPVARVKTKRTRKVITETPEVNLQGKVDEMVLQLPNLEDILQPAARSDEVSIREEMPKRTELVEDDFGLGVLSTKEVEEAMHLLARTQEIPITYPQYTSSDSEPPQSQIVVVAQVHAPRDGFRKDLSERRTDERAATEPILAQIEPEIGQISEHILAIEPVPIIEPAPIEEPILEKQLYPIIELPEVPHIAIVADSIQTDLPVQSLEETAEASKARKGDRKPLRELQEDEVIVRSAEIPQKKEILRVKLFRKKFVRINRCNENNGQFIDESYQVSVPSKCDFNESFYNLFWTGLISKDLQMRGASTLRSLSSRESMDLHRVPPRPSSLESISDAGMRHSVQPLEIPEQESAMMTMKRLTGDTIKQISIEEPIIPTSTPRKRKRLTGNEELQRDFVQPLQIPVHEEMVRVPDEITFPEQITIAEQIQDVGHAAADAAITSQEIGTVIQESHAEQIPQAQERTEILSLSDYKLRQQRIINIVATWTASQGMLTIEHVCEKPIHRLNIARAFSDLLTLAANKFLILKSEEASIELKYIEKGPKLVN